MAQTRWEDLCKLVRDEDGQPVRDVGAWSEDKLFFWHKYVQQTTTAMGQVWRNGLAYVDLFAGPGVCRIRDSTRRLPGSPLIAAHAPKPFRRIIAVEFDPLLAAACERRLQASPAASSSVVMRGDCNALIRQVIAALPKDALTLAFVDPEALDARFETIRALASVGRVDLLVLFADAYDIVRNVDEYERNPSSKLDQTLGADSGWRDDWRKLQNRSGNNVRELFAGIYQRQLRAIGYVQFGTKVIEFRSGPLYRLVYASKHERGLDFWNKVIAKDKDGQRDLF
jgi:three-Cys-motif partner protein